jgi:protein CpxP
MKKVFLIITTVAALNSVYAQGPKDKFNKQVSEYKNQTPEQRAQLQADKLEKVLSLSTDQKQKVYEAALKKNNSIKAAKEKHKNDADKKAGLGPEIKAANQTFVEDVNAVLTPEQKTKWKAHVEEMKQKHKARKEQMKGMNKPGLKQPNDVSADDEDELAG